MFVSLQFRFYNRFPDGPTFNVPFVNLTHLHCTTDGSRNIPNMKHLLQLDRLHSFRFFSTRVSSKIHDIGLGMSSSTARLHEDRQQTQGDSLQQETEDDSRFCDDLSNLETFVFSGVLRTVFLVLDAVLLLYRFTAMYSNGLTLWRRLTGSSNGSARSNIGRSMSTERTLTPSNAVPDRRHPEFTAAEFGSPLCETSSDFHHRRTDRLTAVGQHRQNCVKRRTEVARVGSSDVVFAHLPSSTQSNGESVKVIVIRILQSGTLIKFLFAGVVLLVSYVVLKSTVLFLNTEVFIGIDCFNMYINAIAVQMNESNWYVSDEAKHLNQLAVDYHRNHVQSELTNLKGLLEYFNSGIPLKF